MVGINDLGSLGECAGLETLDLSRNDVTKLYGLAGLTNLVYLNLSCNRISVLGTFRIVYAYYMITESPSSVCSEYYMHIIW